MKYLKVFPCLLLFFIVPTTEARWCKYEDATFEYEFINKDVIINDDGSYEVSMELRGRILTESSRSHYTHYRLNYNSNISKISILEAKTIYNGREHIVTHNMIEDKPLASPGHGFDQMNQVIISFPNIEVGAEIYLRYRVVVETVPVENFYSNVIHSGSYIKALNTKFKSKLPLHVKVNDPRHALKVESDTKNGIHNLSITLRKPIFNSVTNEPQAVIINRKHSTWVSLSSLNNWKDLAKKLAAGYNKVINQELPSMFVSIANAVSDKDSDDEKINFVTSKLNEKIQYNGDWRTVEGRFFPRDLKKVASSQIGDCKDFSSATAAILQKLGYKVQPVLVSRGLLEASDRINTLPTLNEFNHVILKVTNKKSQVYWIDPTNVVSMAQGIFPDIADRDALLLDDKDGGLIRIPKVEYKNSKIVHHSEFLIQNDLVTQQGIITLQGESALDYAGTGLYRSNEQLREMAFNIISGVHLTEDEKKFLELPDLTSRIVKDITVKYAFQQKNKIFKTNLGDALTLSGDGYWINKVISTTPDQVSDIFIDVPKTIEIHRTIKNVNVKNCNRLNFEAVSPWLHVNRSCRYQDGNTQFINTILILKSFITAEELQSEEYKNLKNKLESNVIGASVIIN